MKIKPDFFLIGMGIAIFLAWLMPAPGAEGGILHPELLTKIGIALVFFLHGILLSFTALKDGIFRWKYHVIIQSVTFLLFPLLGFAFISLAGDAVPGDLKLGFFYLCALPSTVSSSVAMTAAARGNVAVAVFNATISSLIGIFLTPFWMSLLMHSTAQHLDLSNVIIDLLQWMVLPLVIGQLLRPIFGAFAQQHKRFINKVDRGTILLLVYTSFCDSFLHQVWTQHSISTMLSIGLATIVLFFLVISLLIILCKRFHIAPEFRVAIVFCGTKKSLATGVPMARLMFGSDPSLSLILLPIMLYHPLQLLLCAPLASYWAKRQG